MLELDFEMESEEEGASNAGNKLDLAPIFDSLGSSPIKSPPGATASASKGTISVSKSSLDDGKAGTDAEETAPTAAKKLTFHQSCQKFFKKDSKLRPARSKVRLKRLSKAALSAGGAASLKGLSGRALAKESARQRTAAMVSESESDDDGDDFAKGKKILASSDSDGEMEFRYVWRLLNGWFDDCFNG